MVKVAEKNPSRHSGAPLSFPGQPFAPVLLMAASGREQNGSLRASTARTRTFVQEIMASAKTHAQTFRMR